MKASAACSYGVARRTVADGIAVPVDGARMAIEHPTGVLKVEVQVVGSEVLRTAVVRTARKLFDGTVFPRAAV